MHYLYFFAGTFIASWLITLLIKKIAVHYGILDYPGEERKIHSVATPLLGGAAIFISFCIALIVGNTYILSGSLQWHHWIGVLMGSLILMIGGALDDIKRLKPGTQLIFPVLAALAVVGGGVGIEKITDPSGGFLYLSSLTAPFTIVWLIGMSYTTKLLDGIDGLVSSIGLVGSLVIFLFTLTTRWYQPDIAFAALMLAAACCGFLVLNWHPAKIFLGDGGSLFIGFMLGVLSIISGGKIAIALLIMGVPILDVAWTILRRLLKGKNPFKSADRQHLHFRLLDAGLGQRATVLVFCLTSAIFGLSGLFLQSKGKVYSLVALTIVMLAIITLFAFLDNRKKTS